MQQSNNIRESQLKDWSNKRAANSPEGQALAEKIKSEATETLQQAEEMIEKEHEIRQPVGKAKASVKKWYHLGQSEESILARREAKANSIAANAEAKLEFKAAKNASKVDRIVAAGDAKVAQMEKGAAARVAEMEAKQASGLFGRFNFLKGYHGGNNMKAGGQVAAEALAPAGKMTGKVMKLGAIAAVAAGGLAAVGMMSRKPVSEASIEDEALSPSELAEINPAAQGAPISEDPALGGGQTLMGQPPAPGEWAARVGGDAAPALASVKTPSIAEDMHADKITSQDSEYSVSYTHLTLPTILLV